MIQQNEPQRTHAGQSIASLLALFKWVLSILQLVVIVVSGIGRCRRFVCVQQRYRSLRKQANFAIVDVGVGGGRPVARASTCTSRVSGTSRWWRRGRLHGLRGLSSRRGGGNRRSAHRVALYMDRARRCVLVVTWRRLLRLLRGLILGCGLWLIWSGL